MNQLVRRSVYMLVFFLLLGIRSLCSVQAANDGLSQLDLVSLLDQIPSEAPVGYLLFSSDLLPNQGAVVVGTNLYFVGDRDSQSAKMYIFSESSVGWSLVYETDMDERLAAQELPRDWEMSLGRVELADLDGDNLEEVAIFWDSEPWMSVSLGQFSTILHIIDYDLAGEQFYEATNEQIVYNTYKEASLLLNVDCDPQDEVILFEEIWEGNTCVTCAKRYRISVWTLLEGRFSPDPAWNNGQPRETTKQLSLYPAMCDFSEVVRELLSVEKRE